MHNFAVLVVLLGVCFSSIAKEPYRHPSGGDAGSYYIISSEKDSDGRINVLSSRIGKGNAYTDFTQLRVDCVRMQYFEVAGGSEDGAKDKPSKPLHDWSRNSKWTPLVTGSSKSDLVHFVCKKLKN